MGDTNCQEENNSSTERTGLMADFVATDEQSSARLEAGRPSGYGTDTEVLPDGGTDDQPQEDTTTVVC